MIREALSLTPPPRPSASTISEAARVALWQALMDVEGACEVARPSSVEVEGEIDPAAIDSICGVNPVGVFRFLSRDTSGRLELVSGLPPCDGPQRQCTGSYVDLKAIGHRLADLAERPLVTLGAVPAG